MWKLKEGFILRSIVGETVVIPSGDELNLNILIILNGTGAFLWERLEKGSDLESLTAALLAEYDVDSQTARTAVEGFVKKLEAHGFLQDETDPA